MHLLKILRVGEYVQNYMKEKEKVPSSQVGDINSQGN